MKGRSGPPQSFNPYESVSGPEELEITRLIFDRLVSEQCLRESDRETVAYRIAEIMVCAKQMYTRSLPRLTNVCGESDCPMEDDLAGLQMTFLHLCDLMHDFESAFLQSLGLPPPGPEAEIMED